VSVKRAVQRGELPPPCRLFARSLDADLAAGIPKVTPAGKLDFHAVRVAYINLVIESGVTVKEAQVLARHETPELTMNIYGRAREERLWNAVEQVAHTIRVTSVSQAAGDRVGQSAKARISQDIEKKESALVAGSIPAASILPSSRNPLVVKGVTAFLCVLIEGQLAI
jgi:hypothetical protein